MDKPTIFKYGQILVSKKETILEGALTGKKTVVPKGNRIVVGFDGFAHHLNGGYIQPFGEDVRLEGFSSSGIIEVIQNCLFSHFPIKEMCEDYEIDPDDIRKELIYALDEIGLCENTEGNI